MRLGAGLCRYCIVTPLLTLTGRVRNEVRPLAFFLIHEALQPIFFDGHVFCTLLSVSPHQAFSACCVFFPPPRSREE